MIAIPNVTPDQAPKVFCGVGYAYIETGDIAAARQNAETCRKWAKTDVEMSRADQLLKLAGCALQSAGIGPCRRENAENRGMARNLECSAEGNRLQIVAGNKLISFDIPEPEAVETTQKPPGFTLACGAAETDPDHCGICSPPQCDRDQRRHCQTARILSQLVFFPDRYPPALDRHSPIDDQPDGFG